MSKSTRESSLLAMAAAGLLLAALVSTSALAGGVGRSEGASKQAALESIGRTVIAPAYADVAAKSAAFAAAADALVAKLTLPALKNAQEAWRQVLVAWRRTQAFAHGPVADLGVYPRIQFWPPRRQNIDRVLRGQRPIDDGYVQELGANAVGLSALELILFDAQQDDAARVTALTGPAGERERLYLQALDRALVKDTSIVARAWQGSGGYATSFGAGGQPQLNLLVNDMLEAIEVGAENRLRVVLEHHAERQFRSQLLEGGLSGTSQTGLLALLRGARNMFSGGDGLGIDDYLRQLKSPAAARTDAQFQRAIDAVQALGGPLEDAALAREAAVRQAHEECRALELLLKVEVASALGVTLTFKAIDGD